MKTKAIKISLTCLVVLVSTACLHAGTITKANNANNLNLTTSWVGGVVPGPLDTASWDSTVTNANTVALGADTVWAGINIANPAGAVTISAGNTLTLGTNGINMSAATQSLTISSGLTLGAGAPIWNVAAGQTLTVNGTLTRTAGTALVVGSQSVAAASQGTVTASPTLEHSVIPWASQSSSDLGYSFATVIGGNIVPYVNANYENLSGPGQVFGGIPIGDNSTQNYDVNSSGSGDALTNDLYVNTLRNEGGAVTENGTANFRANAIMNDGAGVLLINTPMQAADTNLSELVLAPWFNGIVLSNIISDNVYPLHVTIYGGSSNIFGSSLSTFSGGVTINRGASVGIRAASIPTNGTPLSGPLGIGTITMNGGLLYSSVGSYAVGNPIVIGPGGAQFQYSTAQPDLNLTGPVTGSGPIIMNGTYNVNGMGLYGDLSAYSGTLTVLGSNNRLGTNFSGSALARFVVNGGLAGQIPAGASYQLGELSGSTSGCLCGHAANTVPSIVEWVVGALNTSTTYSGIIINNTGSPTGCGNSDGSANNLVALTKIGTGTLTLNGASGSSGSLNSGPTTINGGTLQIGTNGTTGIISTNSIITDNANLQINRSNAATQGTDFSLKPITGTGTFTQIGSGTTTLKAANTYTGGTYVVNGTLFVNGSDAGADTVYSGATLGGSGTIAGVVTVMPGGKLGAGATATNFGTLTLNSTPVLNGSVFVKINASTAQADLIAVTGGNPINYGGTLVVSNTDGPLLAGDSFTIFTAGAHNGNFSSIVGTPDLGLAYSFNNGVLSVVSTGRYATNTTPTNVIPNINTVITSYDTNGDAAGWSNTVTISWPSNHLGWFLEAQTNDVNGSLSNNPAAWYIVPGSSNMTMLGLPNPTDLAVYYRMLLNPPPLPANAPTGLTARGTNTAVILNWTAPTYARTYNIQSSTTSGGPYAPLATTIATTYTNTGLVNGTPYYYVVNAQNYYGQTINSAQATATPSQVPVAAPTNLTAQVASQLVFLTWSNVPTAVSYNVKRGPTTGSETTIANVGANSFSDTNVVNGTPYYYVVSALNSQFNLPVEGPNSSETNATPLNVAPPTPTNVVATAQYLQVRVTWAASFGATSYNVYSSTTNGGPYSLAGSATTTTFYNTGLTAGTNYYYVVTAVSATSLESGNSAQVNATPTDTLPLQFDFENTSTNYSVTNLPALPTPGTFTYIYPLPDPWYWVGDPLNIGGTASTNYSDWEHHRAEILAEIQTYEIGTKPAVDPSMESVSISGSGSSRTLTVVTTNVVGGTNLTLTQTAAITIPSGAGNTNAAALYPICIGMNGPNGSVNSTLLTAVAKMTFTINQVSTYGAKANTDAFYVLYPNLNPLYTGQYAAWSWGCSRLIDGLYKLNGNLGGGVKIDLTRIMVTGCSYAGKMALFCGALDERVTLTIAQESGGGGANSWRYNEFDEPPGTVEDIGNTDYGWFGQEMKNFADTNVVFLPEDHHMLDALAFPRALFVTGNPSQVWLGSRAFYVCSQAAAQVWDSNGVSNRFGFNNLGDHGHCATESAIDTEMGTYINTYLLQSNNINTYIRDNDASLSGVNYSQWTTWWGTTNPVLGP